ncbi:DUF1641 domain-containing protein [Bremerella alba]|uniref:Uncharacterized protein n=1 Tax=Bremerella alba TaxID=980252 RepID=A0A7V9A843_9BACT|nr:DUF1641 domain-containing protein [Bremerella alba]MBA2116075.1 hypothetical protein [Bremerella alba]
MAHRIPFQPLPYDHHDIIQARLQTAPMDHGEAILSACQVLQGLQDQGILDILRGLLDSRDEVLETAVDAANSPHTIRGIRNLLIIADLLGDLDPQQLKNVTQAIPLALGQITHENERLGFWHSLSILFVRSRWRRPMAAIAAYLQAVDH